MRMCMINECLFLNTKFNLFIVYSCFFFVNGCFTKKDSVVEYIYDQNV